MKAKIKGDLRCSVRFSTNQDLTSSQSKKISDFLREEIYEIMKDFFDFSTSSCKVFTVIVRPNDKVHDL